MVMRTSGLCGLIAAVLAGSTLVAAAEAVPLPVPAPNKSQITGSTGMQPPRPSATIPNPMQSGPVAATIAKPSDGAPFDASHRALIDRVSAYLSSVQNLVGNFVQVGPDGRRTEGQFYIQKPGKVKFEYNPPSPIDVIADGSSVVVRDRRLATQDLYPLSQTPLRFLLAEKLDLQRDTNLVSVSADDMFVTVVMEEKSLLAGTNRLMLMFGAKDFQLRQWTVTDPQGFDTTVAVYNLDTTKKIDPNMFRITYGDRPDPR